MSNALAKTTSWLATAARLGRARSARHTPEQDAPIVLYEYEACPMCRRVREAVTDLGLTVDVRPCPVNGTRFRSEAEQRSERVQFPFLVDPNNDVAMLESADIVAYLYETYGDVDVPSWLTGIGFVISSQLATMARAARGGFARGTGPTRRVELRCNESDPEARRVREVLCELEVPYLRTPGELRLRDPESGVQWETADAAVDWLESEFGTGEENAQSSWPKSDFPSDVEPQHSTRSSAVTAQL